MPQESTGHADERKAQLAARIPKNEHMRAPHRWGDVFGDQVVAAAMIDRIVHHAEVLTLKGSSYRLKDTGIDTLPSARADNTAQ
jgi:phage FluMu gp28-like protein